MGKKASFEHKESRDVDWTSGHCLHGDPIGCAVESWPSSGTWDGTKVGIAKAPPACQVLLVLGHGLLQPANCLPGNVVQPVFM